MAPKTIYSDRYRHLVQRLRALREEIGLTQSTLARELGWPQQRLSAVEAGARRLDVMEFLHLTSRLGLSPEEAIGIAIQTAHANLDRQGVQRKDGVQVRGRQQHRCRQTTQQPAGRFPRLARHRRHETRTGVRHQPIDPPIQRAWHSSRSQTPVQSKRWPRVSGQCVDLVSDLIGRRLTRRPQHVQDGEARRMSHEQTARR